MIYWVVKSILYKNKKTSLNLLDTIVSKHRVKLSDIDIYLHMNNAKYLKNYEAARWNFGIETSLTAKILKANIKFIVCAAELAYIKELKWNKNYEIHTQFAGNDEKYFYWEQKMIVNGKTANHGMFKVLFLGKKGVVPSQEIFNLLGLSVENKELPEHFNKWKEIMVLKQK
jgi:YbgC/YbaW family acyl-CoA thioester hydrolase